MTHHLESTMTLFRGDLEFEARVDGYLVHGDGSVGDPEFFVEDICAWRPDSLAPRGEAEVDLSESELDKAYDLLMDKADADGLLGK